MMRRSLIILVAAALVAAGCQPQAKNASPPPTGQGEVQANAGTAPTYAPDADPAGAAPDDKMPKAEITFPAQTFKIDPPGAGDWKPAPAEASRAAALGDAVDKALASVSGAFVEADTNFEMPDVGKLTGKAQIRIENPSTYMVQYYTVEDQSARRKVVADGNRRAELGGDGWKQLPDPKAPPKPKEVTEADVKAFGEGFLQTMHSRFLTGENVWGPMMRAWEEGKGGYTVRVETKTVKLNGKDRRIQRVVAETKQGTPTQIEILIDGQRNLPLTVRSVETLPGGKQNRIMWTGRWAFGGKHEKSSFALPADLNP